MKYCFQKDEDLTEVDKIRNVDYWNQFRPHYATRYMEGVKHHKSSTIVAVFLLHGICSSVKGPVYWPTLFSKIVPRPN